MVLNEQKSRALEFAGFDETIYRVFTDFRVLKAK